MNQLLTDRVSVIKALAHPTRLHIAEILSDGPVCVSDIQAKAGSDLSTISKHLSIMRDAGWLSSQKQGLHIFYSLSCSCLDDFLRCVDTLASNPNSCC